jgi:hypothetical protein
VIRRIPIDTGMCHKSIEKTMTVFWGNRGQRGGDDLIVHP